MRQVTSFGIDMSLDLSQITAGEYQQMTEEEQLKVMTEVYRELFFRNLQDWSLHAIDVMEAQGINDYEEGHSRLEVPLAFLRVSATVLHQCFTEQHRRELQVMNEDSQFAASLTESIYDHLTEIQKLTEDMVTLQTYYSAALSHRKESNANLLDAEGNTKPYSAELLERERLIKLQAEEEWRQDLREMRSELERVYRGEQEPAPLEEGLDNAQLPLPLWTAGYCVV